MMQSKTISVTCPACCEEGNFKIYPFVNAAEDPEIKERIFSRDLFRYVCPECGEEILAAYNCTYLDETSEFMVALITDNSDARIETTGYTLRIVRSINEFVEKIAIMEEALDDRIIELYKIMLEDQFEEERQGAEILGIYYGGQNFDDKSLLFYIITGNAENCRATLSFDTYEMISKQFDAYPEMSKDTSEINRLWAIGTLQSGFSEDNK